MHSIGIVAADGEAVLVQKLTADQLRVFYLIAVLVFYLIRRQFMKLVNEIVTI